MAGVVTLLDESDESDLSSKIHIIRRSFRYVREIGDDEIIIVTPTGGDAVNQKKGFIDAPWTSNVSISVSNLSVGALTPNLDPALAISHRAPADITNDFNEGQIVDLLAGEDRVWPASFPVNFPEQVRTFPVGSQATGGRTFFLVFGSTNATAAAWEFSIQCKDSG